MSSVLLLAGSGLSLGAGMPSTQDITRVVVSGNGVWRHTDELYYLGDPPKGYLPHPASVPLIVNFLAAVGQLVDDYYRGAGGNRTSYEDLYYVARQVADCESQEYDNPAVSPLCHRFEREFRQALERANASNHDEWDLSRLAYEGCSYIADIASNQLSQPPKTTAGVEPLLRAFCTACSSGGTIVTLNHDTVLETTLGALTIPFTTGFQQLSDLLDRWDPDELEDESPIRLLKLHGSVD